MLTAIAIVLFILPLLPQIIGLPTGERPPELERALEKYLNRNFNPVQTALRGAVKKVIPMVLEHHLAKHFVEWQLFHFLSRAEMDKFAKEELKTIGITDAVVSFFHARDMFLNIFLDQLPKIFPRSNDGEVADNARMKFVKDECSRITNQLPENIRKDDHAYLLSGAAVWAKLKPDERQSRLETLKRIMEYIYGKDKYEEKVEAILAGARAHEEKLTKNEKSHLKGAEVQHNSPALSEKL